MMIPFALFRRRYAQLLLAGGIVSNEPLLSTSLAGVETNRPSPELMTFEAIERHWESIPNDQLRTAADRGDVTAQSLLGWRLLYGRNGQTNHAAGADLLRKAAEQGFAYAQCQYGWLHEEGRGVAKNRDTAMDWTIKSAEQGFTPAEVNLGWLYSYDKVKPGQTITGNYPVAAEWYAKAAQKGHANAQFLLAELYHYGKLGDAQRSNCIPWYIKAARQGHTKAQGVVGSLHRYYPKSQLLSSNDIISQLRQAAEKGDLSAQLGLARRLRDGDGVAKDSAEAFKWMQRAANNPAQNTRVSDAQYELACMYEDGLGVARNLSEASRWFLSAAGESPDAQFRVGRMFEEGAGVTKDLRQAAEFYSRAATRGFGTFQGEAAKRFLRLYAAGEGLPKDQDQVERQVKQFRDFGDLTRTNASVQFYLGEIYHLGKVVSKDDGIAVEHYSKAAKLGSAEGQNRIGEMWAAGMQGQSDAVEAASWFRKAAMQGLADAQYNLGMCRLNGNGVERNPTEAWQWLQLAAIQGHDKAISTREALERTMPPEHITEAKAKVASFKPVIERGSPLIGR